MRRCLFHLQLLVNKCYGRVLHQNLSYILLSLFWHMWFITKSMTQTFYWLYSFCSLLHKKDMNDLYVIYCLPDCHRDIKATQVQNTWLEKQEQITTYCWLQWFLVSQKLTPRVKYVYLSSSTVGCKLSSGQVCPPDLLAPHAHCTSTSAEFS